MIDVTKMVRKCVLDLGEYVPGKPIEEVRRELGLDNVIKLSSNENPLGSSPLAVQAMLREVKERIHFYPEGLSPVLASRLADIHQLDPGQIFINNGVDGVLSMIGLAFVEPEDEVLASQFSFTAYQLIARRMGCKPVLVPQTPDRRIDVDGMIAALSERTKVVFFCNPNNPTGTISTREEFERLLAAVPENVLLVSDEAYYDFVDDPKYPQTLTYSKDHPNLVITRTFSKVMGLAGLRVGYAMAHPDIVRVLRKVSDPFPVNRVAQAGALASLDDREFLRCTVEMTIQGRNQLAHGMRQMGLQVYPSQANFVLVDLRIPSTPVYEAMLREGVIVRPLAPQGLPTCLRITVGLPEQNERALAALKKALENC